MIYFLLLLLTGAMKTVMGEGMPEYRNPFVKGNLHITFDVTFPPNNFVSEDQLKVSMSFFVIHFLCQKLCPEDQIKVSMLFCYSLSLPKNFVPENQIKVIHFP
jgi:DnaJ-class molecular chaperone